MLIRNLLGIFLILNGVIIFCAGCLAMSALTFLVISSLASSQPGETLYRDPLSCGLVAIGSPIFVMMGHLMMLFGQSITSSTQQAFPLHRPALWFSLHTLRQSARVIVAGAFVAFATSGFANPPSRQYLIATVVLLAFALTLPVLSRRIEAIDARQDPAPQG